MRDPKILSREKSQEDGFMVRRRRVTAYANPVTRVTDCFDIFASFVTSCRPEISRQVSQRVSRRVATVYATVPAAHVAPTAHKGPGAARNAR
ncbi:hypothetical protein D3C81_1784020 [compost metagenome]